ncbi:outer membrane protein [Flavobacterium soyangense]|uniref:Outer membrane beta-barrel protein n=1 Tax=Flavobacterium soyangense TaxID=2023265 RepID=A0A930XZ28_9FLAO|nr:outer membrane beta-barrel protein [Flavobacterium soyangense]MBF2708453.1 outer membrane beta-barrel protein [Flavobacterium soyangense]
MKKIILTTVMLIGLAFTTQAQDISKNAIGLRLGDNDGFGAEVSYQRGLSNSNRLELDLGWRNRNNYHNNGYYGKDNALKLSGLYQWVWNIDEGFNWYAGVGGGFGSYNSDYNGVNDNGVFAFAAGDVGIEYNFDFPLQLSLDFRPELGGNGYYDNGYSSDIALGVRYRF